MYDCIYQSNIILSYKESISVCIFEKCFNSSSKFMALKKHIRKNKLIDDAQKMYLLHVIESQSDNCKKITLVKRLEKINVLTHRYAKCQLKDLKPVSTY